MCSSDLAQQAASVAEGSSAVDSSPGADRAESPSSLGHDLFDTDNPWEQLPDARQDGFALDSVLDELVDGLLSPLARNTAQASSPTIALPRQNGARPEAFAARAIDSAPAVLPAGPLARLERDRPAEGLAEFLMIAGLCGFGAQVMKPRSAVARTIASPLSRPAADFARESEKNRRMPRSN